MDARFGAFYHTKYSESHDNMTQIILPSKINCIDTSDEIQYHQKDTAQTKVAHCMGTSNEIQFHPLYFEANFSPPSSGNHWLLFVKPMKRGAQEVGNGVQKGEEPSTKEWWERHLFPQKTRTSVTNRCPYTLQIYVLW